VEGPAGQEGLPRPCGFATGDVSVVVPDGLPRPSVVAVPSSLGSGSGVVFDIGRPQFVSVHRLQPTPTTSGWV
jgi:hypothetical protein